MSAGVDLIRARKYGVVELGGSDGILTSGYLAFPNVKDILAPLQRLDDPVKGGKGLMSVRTVPATRAEAPWRDGLSQQVALVLELPDIQALPQSANFDVDVAVVGAGVAGLSAAISAAAAGARVLLLESAPHLGHGASGRNAGILSPGVNMPLVQMPPDSPAAALWSETNDLLHELLSEAQKPGSILKAHRTGSFILATSRTAARRLTQEARARALISLRAELCDPTFVTRATDGRLSVRGVELALWLPDEGRIQPLTLLANLARQARSAGAVLAGSARVVNSIEQGQIAAGDRRPSWRLSLENGMTIVARALIRAVGPVSNPTARIYALAFEDDLPADFPLFWDANPYVYYDFRPGDGKLVVSGGRYGRPGAVERDRSYHERMADAARRWLPELVSVTPSHAWAVDLNVASDLLPAIRPLGQSALGASIEGLGALGVLPGIALGRRAGRELAERL